MRKSRRKKSRTSSSVIVENIFVITLDILIFYPVRPKRFRFNPPGQKSGQIRERSIVYRIKRRLDTGHTAGRNGTTRRPEHAHTPGSARPRGVRFLMFEHYPKN